MTHAKNGPTRNAREREREEMVATQMVARGLRDRAVLDAIRSIPRDLFIAPEQAHLAYQDKALPVGPGQTISQPFIVAYMTSALRICPGNKVLEVGTGTGYQAAVLSRLTTIVHTLETDANLSAKAAMRLSNLGIENVTCHVGDGGAGFGDAAPYDRIMVTAALPSVPDVLMDQLATGGVLLAPVGGRTEQVLIRITKRASSILETFLLPVRFVPLVGPFGFDSGESQG